MMHAAEKSDLAIVAGKPAKAAVAAVAEAAEPRACPWLEQGAGAKGNAGQTDTRRTPGRVSVSPGLERVRQDLRGFVAAGDVGQQQFADIGVKCEPSRFGCGQMPARTSECGVAFEERRLDDQRVGAPHRLDQRSYVLAIAYHGELDAGNDRPVNHLGRDAVPLGEHDRAAVRERGTFRSFRNAERIEALGQKRSSRLLLE